MKKHTHKAMRTTEFCSCGAIRTNGGEWVTGRDPNAVALGNKYAAMSTPEQRQEIAAQGGSHRWKGITAKERSTIMREVAARPRPNARIEDRCECGRFSREYAERHRHVCGKALQALQEASHGR